jgi:hypothetical protein
MTATVVPMGDTRVSVDYLSSFHYGYTCVFSIVSERVIVIYISHLEPATAALPRAKLCRHLLENLPRATLVRSVEVAA